MEDQLKNQIINTCVFHMKENLGRLEKCFKAFNDDLLWNKTNSNSNSIGNLTIHLNGNITQYILSALGDGVDHRDREEEFEGSSDLKKNDLLKQHTEIVDKACQIIQGINLTDLTKSRLVQGFEMTGIEIIVHVTEHYSYHVGQIAFVVKSNNNVDLGFYKDFDLNILNDNN